MGEPEIIRSRVWCYSDSLTVAGEFPSGDDHLSRSQRLISRTQIEIRSSVGEVKRTLRIWCVGFCVYKNVGNKFDGDAAKVGVITGVLPSYVPVCGVDMLNT